MAPVLKITLAFPAAEAKNETWAKKVVETLSNLEKEDQERVHSDALAALELAGQKWFDAQEAWMREQPNMLTGWKKVHYFEYLDAQLKDHLALANLCTILDGDLAKALLANASAKEQLLELYSKKGSAGLTSLSKVLDDAFEVATAEFESAEMQEVLRGQKGGWMKKKGYDVAVQHLVTRAWEVEPLVAFSQMKPDVSARAKALLDVFRSHFGSSFAESMTHIHASFEESWNVRSQVIAEWCDEQGLADAKVKWMCVEYVPHLEAYAQENGIDIPDVPKSASTKKAAGRSDKSNAIGKPEANLKEGSTKVGRVTSSEMAGTPKKPRRENNKTTQVATSPGRVVGESPRKRYGVNAIAGDAQVEWRTVHSLMVDGLPGDASASLGLKAEVVDIITDAMSERTPRLKFVLGDETAVIQATVYQPLADQVLRQWQSIVSGQKEKSDDVAEEVSVAIEIIGFKLSAAIGVHPTGSITIANGAQWRFENSDKALDFSLMGADLIVDDFNVLASKAEAMSANLMGVVGQHLRTSTTQNGKATLTFELVDSHGSWLTITAHGSYAESPVLRKGNHIRVYFLKSSYEAASKCFKFWLFEDAFVQVELEQARIPNKRMEIIMKDK